MRFPEMSRNLLAVAAAALLGGCVPAAVAVGAPGGPRSATDLRAEPNCSHGSVAELVWKPAAKPGQKQRVDVTTHDFTGAEFESSEPIPPDRTSFTWNRVQGQATHFWRVLTLHGDEWVASATSTFTGATCVFDRKPNRLD
jgi:hypothetical protein